MPSFLPIPDDSDFTLDNLPYGVFSPEGRGPRVGVAVGEHVVDLAVLESAGCFDGTFLRDHPAFDQPSLNLFLSLGKEAWDEARRTLQDLLDDGSPTLRDDDELREAVLHRQDEVTMHLPFEIGDYTDFYASRQHATNVGTMFRGKENALMPNWLHLPVGYHGRASSVVVSGTDVVRPAGQTKPEDGDPVYGPSRLLDFELELGAVVGPGNPMGTAIGVDDARDHIFGYVLVNDWSARDIQKWEYVPLGPFLGKSFCTSISPWVVPAAALEPFRIEGEAQSGENPEPLPYLQQSTPRSLDIALDVAIESEQMRENGEAPHVVARSNAKNLYWSFEQQLAHHTVNGCPMRPGDLFASGTISGDEPGSYGSMLEITWRGQHPVELPTGETRKFIADGDRVVMRGRAERGGVRVGFGEVSGRVVPNPGS
jgi:fumarylacetoacetase